MNRGMSWTRCDYGRAYRMMRSEVKWDLRGTLDQIPDEIVEAADYSYQAYGYEPHGWLSDRRYKRFLEIKWRIFSQREFKPHPLPPIQIDIDRW